MVKQKSLVAIFDVDGTLIDSGRKLKMDVVNAFAGLGKIISPEEVSGDWYRLAEQYGFSKEQFDEAFNHRKSWQQSLYDGECPLFNDTIPCLDALKQRGIRLAALSKSIPEYTFDKIDFHKLRRYFDDIETVHPREKDKVRGALDLTSRLDPETIEKAYFIGDTPGDVTIARDVKKKYSLSTEGIYVCRTTKPANLPAECNLVNSLNSIPEIIRRQNGK